MVIWLTRYPCALCEMLPFLILIFHVGNWMQICFTFLSQEVEQNGEEHEEQGTQEEEAVEVDADSTDGAVLVNSNETEEEWGTNNEGTSSA